MAGDDPGVLANAALSLAYFGEDIGAMTALVDRALALNPNFARGWQISGTTQTMGGPTRHRDRACGSTRCGSAPAPGSVTPFALIGAAHLLSRRFDEAVPKLLLAIQEDPSFPLPYRSLAACYAHMGRLDEAREIVAPAARHYLSRDTGRRLRAGTPSTASYCCRACG